MKPSAPFMPQSGIWLANLSKNGKSDNTVECYERDLRDVAAVLGKDLAGDLTSCDQSSIDQLHSVWSAQGCSSATILRRLSALRAFAKFLCCTCGVDCSRLLSAVLPRLIRRHRPGIDDAEVQAALELPIADQTWVGLRDSAMFSVQASAAVTTAELIALDVRNLKLSQAVVVIAHTHLTPRTVGIAAFAVLAVQNYLASLSFVLAPHDPLFVTNRGGRLTARTVQLRFRRRRRALGIRETACPIGLRHGVGEKLAAAGHSPATIACALGLSPVSVSKYFSARNIV